MKYFKLNNITKKVFDKLKEEDVLFITHPGMMGDEDGSTFIVKNGNSLIAYRANHWMYDIEKCEVQYEDMEKSFPKWVEEYSKDLTNSKYKLYYMGFGNDLCVDKSIVDIFEKNLETCIIEKAKLEDFNPEERRMELIYNTWDKAAYLTANELKYDIEYTDEETFL